MGMTIDEAISHLDTYSSTMGSGQTTQEQHEDAKRVAIATMRKYQKLEQEPTTKNDLGVDCISRAEAIKCLECDFDITGKENMKTVVNYINSAHDKIVNLPSVTPQEPQTFKWCTDCKEYDQEKHCCHRWSKVIRDTVEEMKQEPILEQIKAEVENINVWGLRYNSDTDKDRKPQIVQKVKEHVIAILDKYKAESEG